MDRPKARENEQTISKISATCIALWMRMSRAGMSAPFQKSEVGPALGMCVDEVRHLVNIAGIGDMRATPALQARRFAFLVARHTEMVPAILDDGL